MQKSSFICKRKKSIQFPLHCTPIQCRKVGEGTEGSNVESLEKPRRRHLGKGQGILSHRARARGGEDEDRSAPNPLPVARVREGSLPRDHAALVDTEAGAVPWRAREGRAVELAGDGGHLLQLVENAPPFATLLPSPPAAAAAGTGMQAAAAARRRAVALAAAFHSSAAALSKSTPHIQFAVREKRGDAKSALKNLLLNGSPYQESNNKQMRTQKVGGKSKAQRSCPGKNLHSKNKCGQNWRNFDEDDCTDTPYGTFGGKRSFTWYWPGEDDGLGSSPSGFQWREESQSTKSRGKFWNESDVDEEEELIHDNLQSYRITLGLPHLGPLKLDYIKSAFRASALKWHPDKHQGPSQAEAEEKFKHCVEAYNALAGAFK